MENMSRAIIMAGGILIGVITISLFVIMFSGAHSLADMSQTDYDQKEVLDFNQAFTSYNKNLMYGADVLSVLNKAIDNNRRNGNVRPGEGDYSVDIIIELRYSDLEYKEQTWKKTGRTTAVLVPNSTKNMKKTIFKHDANGASYSLRQYQQQFLDMLINVNSSVEDENGNANSVRNKGQSDLTDFSSNNGIDATYVEISYPASQFKRLTFKCSNVHYNRIGRVDSMTFTEVQKGQENYK